MINHAGRDRAVTLDDNACSSLGGHKPDCGRCFICSM